MRQSTRNRRAIGRSLLTALMATMTVCWGAGCAKKSGREAVSEIPNTLTDTRDGKIYRTVKIGKQVWMAENLNYPTKSGSYCYDDSNYYCDKYGRLYDWKTAKTVCPKGRHLPTRREWDELTNLVGDSKRVSSAPINEWDLDEMQINYYPGHDTLYYWPGAGTKLKSTSGWYDLGGNNDDNGTDDYGFSALPGGFSWGDAGGGDVGVVGIWWTATEVDSSGAYGRYMTYDNDYVGDSYDYKNRGFSVRCVGDRSVGDDSVGIEMVFVK